MIGVCVWVGERERERERERVCVCVLLERASSLHSSAKLFLIANRSQSTLSECDLI